MSVIDYVALGRHARHGLWRGPSPDDHATVGHSLERVGISSLANRDIDSLSGGERQRAVIARALAQTTTFLVMDEPTNGLDVRHQVDILELVRREVVECGATVIATLHDLTLAGHFADTMIVMNDGRIVTRGTAREVAASSQLRDAYGIEIMVVDVAGRDVWVPGRVTT
jgi:iron complex transport system ATP-binding protein